MLAHRLAATAVVFVAACELVGGIPNRVLDEGACVVGERRACYPGPTATRRVGVCADGEQRCLVAGWGPCEGAVEPGVEQCDDGDDHDCDGSPSCAGSPRWSRAFGDATQQLARDGALLHDGRFVVVGIFEGTLALDAHELQSQGFDDIFVAAFEPESGAVSWATSLGGSGSQEREFFDMAVTNDGDLLIAGTLYGAVTVGGMDLAAVQGDGLLVRMSPEGEVRWARLYGGLGLQRLRGVAFDPVSEDIFVAGSYNGSFDLDGELHTTTGGRHRGLVARLDGSGEPLWSRDYGGSDNVFAGAIVLRGPDDLWITGNTQGSVDFGTGPIAPPPGVIRSTFLARLDGDGVVTEAAAQGVAGYSQGEEIALHPSGDIIVTGALTTGGVVDFGDGPIGGAAEREVFIARLRPDFSVVARRTIPGGLGTPALEVDRAGFVVVGAVYEGDTSFGGSILPGLGDWDLAVVKFDGSLQHVWSLGGGAAGKDDVYALATNADGQVFAAGRFIGNLDLGLGPLAAGGAEDLWVALLGP